MELDDEEQWEPYESRGSSTVLRGAGAEMLRPTHSQYRQLDSINDSLINLGVQSIFVPPFFSR